MAIIAHLDLDAFFASCERVRYPDLAGKAIVICIFSGRGEETGAVSTADYAARELGIGAGMPIRQAKHIAESADADVAFLPADKEYYAMVSERVMSIIEEYADDIEVASIDEAYLDLSSSGSYADAVQEMRRLKQEIKADTGVTASTGIGPNKLVAKMASDQDKPDGLTVVTPENVQDFLANLPVRELYGVGPKTAQRLESMNVTVIGDLAETAVQRLIEMFGEAKGVSLHRKANGEGSTELEQREKKQLSRITTLQEDTRSMSDIRPVIRELARDVHRRLRQRDIQYSTVTVIVISSERKTRTRSRTLPAATCSLETMYSTSEILIDEFLSGHPEERLRRVGVRVGNLSNGMQETLDAFG